MRLIGLLLCVSACTLDNPAFFVTDTEAGSASGDATSDPTRPTSTTNASTTASSDPTGSTTDPGTTDSGTTANISDSDVTTDPPATSTSTDATTTTDPQPMTTTSGDTDDPVSCGDIDFVGPQLPLVLADSNDTPETTDCVGWQGEEFSGRLEATPAGFKLVETEDCPSSEVPGEGFVFQFSLGLVPPAYNFECVELRFSVHQGPDQCLVSNLRVMHGGLPVITASFGQTLFDPNMPYQVGYQPIGDCGSCPDCCAPEPDPGTYTFELQGEPIAEGEELEFLSEGKKHLFRNLRSHIHWPQCQTLDLPEWLHFDWVVLRLE